MERIIIKVKYFGLLVDETQRQEEQFSFEKTLNTRDLLAFLYQKYPSLSSVSFRLAINQQLCETSEIRIQNKDEIALLPPFAGG